MSIQPGRARPTILTFAILLILTMQAFCQPAKSAPALESTTVQASRSNDPIVTVGILPNGHIRVRNATLKQIVAAAYNIDEALVTGGPAWLDSDRFDIMAQAPSTASQAERLAMLQALLANHFKLTVHHDKKVNLIYTLTVGKNGPKLQPAAKSVLKNCAPVAGDPKQAHLRCESFSMADLADLLPRVAPNYLELPVVDRTGLTGVYDFPVEWMGRRPYDAAMASAAAGAPRDPLAVSIFDAIAKLGLVLEKRDDPKDTIVVDRAERISAKPASSGTAATELKPDQVSSIDHFVTEEIGRQHIPGVAVGIYSRGEILLAKGYGLANVELNVPVKPETIFQSGSVGSSLSPRP